jgi:acyl-CoA synthetase (AMP-forming)/AMP-acid ligase II
VGAAFTVATPDEQLVVVHECRTSGLDAAQLAGIATAIRRNLRRLYGVGVSGLVLVRPGMVPRTTSGKIQRTLTRELFLTGALAAEYEELSDVIRARYRSVPTAAGAA